MEAIADTWTPAQWYNDGAQWATQVQAQIANGHTFAEIRAATPEQAMERLAMYQDEPDELGAWWNGYLSRWD